MEKSGITSLHTASVQTATSEDLGLTNSGSHCAVRKDRWFVRPQKQAMVKASHQESLSRAWNAPAAG